MLCYFGGRQRYYGGNRSPLIVAVSLLGTLGLFVVALLLFFSAGPHDANAPMDEARIMDTVDVLIPSERIDGGVACEPTMFRRESRPALVVGPRVVRDYEQITGAYAASFITSGEPLHADY